MRISVRRSFVRQITWGGSLVVASLAYLAVGIAQAEVKLPNVFSDHMVLQREQKNKVWGTAEPGEAITVSIEKQSHKVNAAGDGKWHVALDPLPAGGPHELAVKGSNEIKFTDVLVGEVWVCSGQSNMQWWVKLSNDPDLEKLAAKFPKIRMINFPNVGTQEPIWTHPNSKWQVCNPDTVSDFSAVGYFFARQLHQTLDIPVGMVNNAWGGSACEAWIARNLLVADQKFKPLMERWEGMEKQFVDLSAKTDRSEDENKQLNNLRGLMGGNARPGNIYNGELKSHLGYGIKGAIWYQGESNAGRAYQYRDLFPLMIKSWRDEWGQGDFPFYWVQLADFTSENPGQFDSDWAELREAQTMTMDRLPNTGEAVIIDIGEGKDIHPKNKVDVGRRLARWALAKNYGVNIPYHSPRYKSMKKEGAKIFLTFDYVDGGWRPFDVNEPRGFTIAGEDKKWVHAKAEIQKDGTIAVWGDGIENPAAVRYGWANNPVVNMFNGAGLPLTPFRTDDWPGVTAGKN
jgi:sialate O-acetylesterase